MTVGHSSQGAVGRDDRERLGHRLGLGDNHGLGDSRACLRGASVLAASAGAGAAAGAGGTAPATAEVLSVESTVAEPGEDTGTSATTAVRSHDATSPARSSDDLPDPDAPNTPTNGRSATNSRSDASTASRPKNRSASASR